MDRVRRDLAEGRLGVVGALRRSTRLLWSERKYVHVHLELVDAVVSRADASLMLDSFRRTLPNP